jgi:hypothetical protein
MTEGNAASAERPAKDKSRSRRNGRTGKASDTQGFDEQDARQEFDEPQVRQLFAKALVDFTRELQEAWERRDVPQRAAEAYRAYIDAVREAVAPLTEGQQRAAEAQRKYLLALQGQGSPLELQQRVTEAYVDYLAALQDMSVSPQLRERATEAYREYSRVLLDADGAADIQQRVMDAYRRYVSAIQEAWSQAPPEAIGVDALATIGGSMIAAATLQAAAATAISQRSMASDAPGRSR